jgi:hypothetical protein
MRKGEYKRGMKDVDNSYAARDTKTLHEVKLLLANDS